MLDTRPCLAPNPLRTDGDVDRHAILGGYAVRAGRRAGERDTGEVGAQVLIANADRNQDSAGAAPRTPEIVAVVPADDRRQVVLRTVHLQCTSFAVIVREDAGLGLLVRR